MGNAGYHHFLEVNYPTSVSVDVSVDGGHVGNAFDPKAHTLPNIIHMYNAVECATGCGGTFTFQRNVKTLRTSFECKRSFRSEFGASFSAGYTEKVMAQGADLAELKGSGAAELGLSLKLTHEEVSTYFLATEYNVVDESAKSCAYIYHCYGNYDWIEFRWLLNDLHLTPSDDLLFKYKGTSYIKIHPDFSQGDAGPHIGYGLSKSSVQSTKSRLRVIHGGRHKAMVQIAFDEDYMKDGVYTGSKNA